MSSHDDDLDPALAPTGTLGARTREAAPKGGRGSSLVGQVIVHYRVLRELDRGGMGVVYEALDERVARRVAIKVVGEAGDADTALRRFRQEARAIASLNHPNVCTLYEVEEQDGRPVIVMELLEGETLKTRLAREPIDTPQLLQWSLELADALDAAHARGLIHRDIKPGNVFITTRGTVKVLDFGLAKSFAEPEDGAHHDASQTREGTVHGTVPYMSPEQVRGETLDARTDLFSLGAVIYEMAAGRGPFNAVNAGLSVDAVLNQQPPALSSIARHLPAGLAAVVDRALRKNRTERYQNAAEMRSDLRALQDGSRSAASLPASPLRPRRIGLASAAAVGVAIAASAFFLARSRRGSDSEPFPAVPSFASVQVTQLTSSGEAGGPALSPDGRYIVYTSFDRQNDTIRVRQTATAADAKIYESYSNVGGLTVSPDGEQVYFVRNKDTSDSDRQLWRIPYIGGLARMERELVDSGIGWSPDARKYSFVRADRASGATSVVIVDVETGSERVLATRQMPAKYQSLDDAGTHLYRPGWAPDGTTIALAASNGLDVQVAFVDVASGAERTQHLPNYGELRGLAWLDARQLIINRPLDPGAPLQLWRLLYGDDHAPVRLTNDLTNYRGISVTADRDMLVTERMDWRFSIWLGDRAAKQLTLAVPPAARGGSFNPKLTWAGDRILYQGSAPDGLAIMQVTPGRGAPELLIPKAMDPQATRDGRIIVYSSIEPGERRGIWTADDTGRPLTRLTREAERNLTVTPDDRSVVFISARGGTRTPWTVPIAGGEAMPLTTTVVDGVNVAISPDSAQMAFMSGLAPSPAVIVVCDYPACARKRTFTPRSEANGAVPLHWTPDGRAVAFVVDLQTNVWVQPVSGAAAYPLTHFTEPGVTVSDFGWSRDGARLAVSRDTVPMDVVLFKGLRAALGVK